jgi:hypothetical protein
MIKTPSEIIFSACMLMKYWVGLYVGEEQEMIKKGAETMQANHKVINHMKFSLLQANNSSPLKSHQLPNDVTACPGV